MVLRRTLKHYLPAQFHVGTGQVANNRQEVSPQVDALIYDGDTFPHLAVNEDSSVVVCCEALFAAVECKSQWDGEDVGKHYRRFVEVEARRHSIFGGPGMAAGYFVFVVDELRSDPNLMALEEKGRFVGLYSLQGDSSWSSPFENLDFSRRDGNALELFLQDVMHDCMRKGVAEIGSLEYTYEAVRNYFGWSYDK